MMMVEGRDYCATLSFLDLKCTFEEEEKGLYGIQYVCSLKGMQTRVSAGLLSAGDL